MLMEALFESLGMRCRYRGVSIWNELQGSADLLHLSEVLQWIYLLNNNLSGRADLKHIAEGLQRLDFSYNKYSVINYLFVM